MVPHPSKQSPRPLTIYDLISEIEHTNRAAHRVLSAIYPPRDPAQVQTLVEELLKLKLLLPQINELLVMCPSTLDEVNVALYKTYTVINEETRQTILQLFQTYPPLKSFQSTEN